MKPFKAFLGDGEHEFALTVPMIAELEEKRGPIGAIAARVFNRQFASDDLSQVIRCALVGAGESPKRAAELIAAYVADRAFSETYPLTCRILERAWFGAPNEKDQAQ